MGLGFVNSLPVLLGVLFVFGFTGNVVNISVNTQAVGVEALYGRSVMASFWVSHFQISRPFWYG